MLTQARYDAAIDVARRVWDTTEGTHTRHGERALSEIGGVEVHWTGTGGDIADHGDTDTELLSFERFHEVTKRWYDLFYNAAVDSEGFTYAGRDITIRSQSNLNGWLTLLVVVGPDDQLTGPELVAIEAGIRRMWQAVDPTLQPASIRYHRERSATACPGDQIAALVEHIRTTPTTEAPPMALHPDAQTAADAGIWNGADPDQPATREHASIMAQRAKQQAIADAQAIVAEFAASLNDARDRITALEAQLDSALATQTIPDPVRVQIVGIGG